MKRLLLNGLWIVLACFSVFLLSRCSNNDKIHPQKEARVYTLVDKMPQFPGGQQALMLYLNKHIHYPDSARENGIQGTVMLQFIVGTDGSIHSSKAIGKHKGGGLEAEALHVLNNMPKWIPGSEKGKKVPVQYNLPVRFVLQ